MNASEEKCILYEEGNRAACMHDLIKAKLKYCRAIQTSPAEDFCEYIRLTDILRKENKLKQAEEKCRKAISVNPKRIEAFLILTDLLKEQQRFEEATLICSQWAERFPSFYFYWGEILYYQGKYTEAIEVLNKNIERNPSGTAYGNLGWILYNNQRYEEAKEAYRMSMQLKPRLNISYLLYEVILLHCQSEKENKHNYSQVLQAFYHKPNYIKKEILEILTKEISLTKTQIEVSMNESQKSHFQIKFGILQKIVLKMSEDLETESEPEVTLIGFSGEKDSDIRN